MMTEVFIALESTPDEWVSSGENGVVVASCNFPSATIKRHTVNIPGADGSLDSSDAFGGVNYNDVVGKITFITLKGFEEKPSLFKTFNGKQCRIRHSGMEENRYYTGLIQYSDNDNLVEFHKFTLTCYCKPYQYETELRAFSDTVSTDYKLRELQQDGDTVLTHVNYPNTNIASDPNVTLLYNTETEEFNVNVSVALSEIGDSIDALYHRIIEFYFVPPNLDPDKSYYFKLLNDFSEYVEIPTSVTNYSTTSIPIYDYVSKLKITLENAAGDEIKYIGADFRMHCIVDITFRDAVVADVDATATYETSFYFNGIFGELKEFVFDSGDINNETPVFKTGVNVKLISANDIDDVSAGSSFYPLAMMPDTKNLYAVIGDEAGLYGFQWKAGYI